MRFACFRAATLNFSMSYLNGWRLAKVDWLSLVYLSHDLLAGESAL